MADMKSMLPDFDDVTSIASKLFKDIKKSVGEIVDDYKEKHCAKDATASTRTKTSASKPAAAKTEKKAKKDIK